MEVLVEASHARRSSRECREMVKTKTPGPADATLVKHAPNVRDRKGAKIHRAKLRLERETQGLEGR